jgi:hypothetical protein
MLIDPEDVYVGGVVEKFNVPIVAGLVGDDEPGN